MIHQQTYIKVNVPVDKTISNLVSALNSFPELETIESCEDTNNKGAWICFRYGKYWKHPWHDLVIFVLDYMAPNLTSIVGDDVNIKIQVTGSGQIFGELSVRPKSINRVAKALYYLSRNFNDYRYHNSVYCDGTSDTFL